MTYIRKPQWLKVTLPRGPRATEVGGLVSCHGLHTICSSGMCPNRGECWGRGTATFMLGGDRCTRSCKFCNVTTGRPGPLDPAEPASLADSVKRLNLKHVVLTSVDRDDLPDGGAAHWAACIRAIRKACPEVTMETLIPDFKGKPGALYTVLAERPEVVSHNVETVERLTPQVRSVATYQGSLEVLRQIAAARVRCKSGIMLGLGETPDEIRATLRDIRATGCEVITIGQYLQPGPDNWELKEYVHPDTFNEYGDYARDLGFRHVESSPLVRSSYHAEKHVH